jgi:uncharacterized protein (DUF1697 family)
VVSDVVTFDVPRNEGGKHMSRFVSLFRGINVGGNKQVRMDALKELYLSLGCKDVATYIQSGNVVCSTDDMDVAQLARQIEDGFAQKFGFQAKVIMRTADELQEIIADNPFQDDPTKESNRILVLFLASRPTSGAEEDLRKTYLGPEEIHIIGREAYIYYPDGMGRSKLTLTLLEKKLKTAGTGRNWNTVLQLQKLIQRYPVGD